MHIRYAYGGPCEPWPGQAMFVQTRVCVSIAGTFWARSPGRVLVLARGRTEVGIVSGPESCFRTNVVPILFV